MISSGLSTYPWRIDTAESFQRNVTLLHRRGATIRQPHRRFLLNRINGEVSKSVYPEMLQTCTREGNNEDHC